jgi:hypothetical protein
MEINMTNEELYLSYLNESNTSTSRQQAVTDRLAIGFDDLEQIATDLKLQGASTDSLKKQIERASKALNIDKLTLHKGKKDEKCKIGKPNKSVGGTDKYATFKKWFDKQASEKDLQTRMEFVKELQKLNDELEKAYKEIARMVA